MRMFNDNNADLDKNGGLTLGFGGFPDGAKHPTYGYALNDVTIGVKGSECTSDTQPALTYLTGDIPNRTLAASTTHKLTVPLPLDFVRSTATVNPPGGSNAATAAHGILIKSLALNYRVNTTTITSFATMVISYTSLAAGAGLPAATVLTSTLAGNTLTAAANAYLAVSTVTTPAWVTTTDTIFWAVATIVIPGSSTVDVIGASWRVALAIY